MGGPAEGGSTAPWNGLLGGQEAAQVYIYPSVSAIIITDRGVFAGFSWWDFGQCTACGGLVSDQCIRTSLSDSYQLTAQASCAGTSTRDTLGVEVDAESGGLALCSQRGGGMSLMAHEEPGRGMCSSMWPRPFASSGDRHLFTAGRGQCAVPGHCPFPARHEQNSHTTPLPAPNPMVHLAAPLSSCTCRGLSCSTSTCSTTIIAAFQGSDASGRTFTSAYKIQALNKYSISDFFSKLMDKLSGILPGISTKTISSSGSTISISGSGEWVELG